MTTQTVQQIWKITKEIFAEIFKISLLSYLGLYLIEDFFPGFVSSFLDMNIVLGIVVASGIFVAINQKSVSSADEEKELKNHEKIRGRDIVFIIILGIISGFLIYWKTKMLGSLALPISIISGIIIILMSFLLLTEDDENDAKI